MIQKITYLVWANEQLEMSSTIDTLAGVAMEVNGRRRVTGPVGLEGRATVLEFADHDDANLQIRAQKSRVVLAAEVHPPRFLVLHLLFKILRVFVSRGLQCVLQ